MSLSAPPSRPSTGMRRTGYAVALVVNVALLVGVNAWPGWDVVPFLTQDTTQVVPVVNASIVVNLVVNVGYLFHDPPRVRSAGDLLTLAVGELALLRIWQVFPFDLWSEPFDWTLLVRILLGIAIVGSALGMVVALVGLVRGPRDD
jgi:hypothetical protein